jgi:hypothetical protein
MTDPIKISIETRYDGPGAAVVEFEHDPAEVNLVLIPAPPLTRFASLPRPLARLNSGGSAASKCESGTCRKSAFHSHLRSPKADGCVLVQICCTIRHSADELVLWQIRWHAILKSERHAYSFSGGRFLRTLLCQWLSLRMMVPIYDL